jgi:hypothetical protein
MVQFLRKHTSIVFLCVASICIFLFLFFLPKILSSHYTNNESAFASSAISTTTPKSFIPTYISTPEPVKAIYMTSWVASGEKTREPLVKLMDDTEINAVVIDIKDYSGKIVFPVTNPDLKKFGSEEVRISDLQDFIESLHKKGIYVIGRVAVFQDAYFVKFRPDLAVKNAAGTAVWKDHKGISWIDAGSHEYWDYIVQVALESRKIGFDEINFDYIRYPSDGNMQDISFPWSSTTPKATTLKNFFEFLHNSLSNSGLKISADLFGMTTTATTDMGIGQILENALPYFDYVSPMVYPSHYPTTFMGYEKPEAHPYEVVQYAMKSAVDRAEALASSTGQNLIDYKNKLRPWLQDFGLGMTYGSAEVKAQIKATNDDGLSSWLLWSASNKYTKGALNIQ